MSTAIKLRGDTTSNWNTNNPLLLEREIVVDTTTLRFKIGDGVTLYNSLPYMDAALVTELGLKSPINNPAFTGTATLNGEPLGTNNLNGTNYLMVYGTGTSAENAAELQAAYNEAKLMSPTSTNRITIIVTPGDYEFTTSFEVNTSGINVVSLTGNADVKLNGISVNANDVFLKGIDTGVNEFSIIGIDVTTENCSGLNYNSVPSFKRITILDKDIPSQLNTGISTTFNKLNSEGVATIQSWEDGNGNVRVSLGDINNSIPGTAIKIIGTQGREEMVELALMQTDAVLRDYGTTLTTQPVTSDFQIGIRKNNVESIAFEIKNDNNDVLFRPGMDAGVGIVQDSGQPVFHLYNGGGNTEWALFQDSKEVGDNFHIAKKFGNSFTGVFNIYTNGKIEVTSLLASPSLLLNNQSGIEMSIAQGMHGVDNNLHFYKKIGESYTELFYINEAGDVFFTGHINTVASNVEYADNAAAIAGGLPVGCQYRTGDLVKIVH